MGANHSLPIRKKRLEKGRFDNFYYVSCAMQGWRPSMEDRFANYIDTTRSRKFFGVYDGHAGSHTASQLSECLHFLISETDEYKTTKFLKNDANESNAPNSLLPAITSGFIAMDNKLADDQRIQIDISGSTGILLLINESNHLYAAGLGDSRAVISHQGHAQHLSKDHLPTDPSEFARIKAAGGFVANERVNGSLAMSRAFGDFIFKQNTDLPLEDQGVCCRPDIRHRVIDFDKDEFMVIGSDGIWEVLSEQEVVNFIRSRLAKQVNIEDIAMQLLDSCITDDVILEFDQPFLMNQEGIGCDNMTCSIICISNKLQTDPNNNQTTSPIVNKTAQYMIDNTASNYKSRNYSSSSSDNHSSNKSLKSKSGSTKEHSSKNSKNGNNLQASNEFHFPIDVVQDLTRKAQRQQISPDNCPKVALNV